MVCWVERLHIRMLDTAKKANSFLFFQINRFAWRGKHIWKILHIIFIRYKTKKTSWFHRSHSDNFVCQTYISFYADKAHTHANTYTTTSLSNAMTTIVLSLQAVSTLIIHLVSVSMCVYAAFNSLVLCCELVCLAAMSSHILSFSTTNTKQTLAAKTFCTTWYILYVQLNMHSEILSYLYWLYGVQWKKETTLLC